MRIVLAFFIVCPLAILGQVTGSSPFKVSPISLSFTQLSTATALPAPLTVTISTTTGATATANSVTVSQPNSQWLTVSVLSGRLPISIKVAVNPTSLPVGTYTERLQVTPNGTNPVPISIPVTLQVQNPPSDLTVATSSLAFTYRLGDTAPAGQQVNFGTTGGLLSWSASVTGAPWLNVPLKSGVIFPSFTSTMPTSVTTDDLVPGVYKGSIQVSTPDAITKQRAIAVTLGIQPGVPNVISTFPQQIATGSGDLNLTVNGTRFFKDTVFSANGTAVKSNIIGTSAATIYLPATLFLTSGTVSLLASNPNPGGGDSPPWLLGVASNGPVVAAVLNAANYSANTVAPGTVVTFFGRGLGPPSLTVFDNTQPLIGTALAATRVLFQSIPAPILYTSATQVGAMVPYALPTGALASVQVEYNGTLSLPVAVDVKPTGPGIFTATGNGTGQAAAFVVDAAGNMLLNNDKNAAQKGQIIIFYATGEGVNGTPPVDGSIAFTPATGINPTLTVEIGGVLAEVLYAGPSPGLVNGLLQVNAKIPGSATSGKAAPIFLKIGAGKSQDGVTINLK